MFFRLLIVSSDISQNCGFSPKVSDRKNFWKCVFGSSKVGKTEISEAVPKGATPLSPRKDENPKSAISPILHQNVLWHPKKRLVNSGAKNPGGFQDFFFCCQGRFFLGKKNSRYEAISVLCFLKSHRIWRWQKNKKSVKSIFRAFPGPKPAQKTFWGFIRCP